MGKLFSDLTYAPYRSQYVPMPEQELAYLGTALEDKYQKNKAAYNQAEDEFAKVQSLDKDTPLKNQLLQPYNNFAKDFLEKNPNAYEKLGPLIEQTAHQFKNDINYGQLGAIQRNYNLYQDHLKNLKDLYDKGTIDKDSYENAIKYSMDNYQGVEQQQQPTGIYNKYNGYMPAKFQDLTKQAFDLVNGWKEDGTVSNPTRTADGTLWVSYKGKQVKYDEVYNAAMKALMNNPENKQYVNDKVLFSTYDTPDETFNNLDLGKTKAFLKSNAATLGLSGSQIDNMSNKDIYKTMQYFENFHNAASPAAQKEAHTMWDMDWKFDPIMEANARAGAEHLNNAQTTVYTGSTTDNSIDFEGIRNYKKQLGTQTSDIAGRINQLAGVYKNGQQQIRVPGTPEYVAFQQLKKQEGQLQFKQKLQDRFVSDLEKGANWNWNTEYNNIKNQQGTNQEPNLLKYVPLQDIKNYILDGTISDKISSIAKGGANGIGDEDQTIFDQLDNLKDKYKSSISNPEVIKTATEHQIISGNDNTYSKQLSSRLVNAFKGGNIEALNVDGTQFNMQDQFKGYDMNSLDIKPVSGLIGGKPGFAITAHKKTTSSDPDNDKATKTQYVVMDDDSSLLEDYAQTGYDLVNQANSSRYASAPEKKEQLLKTGYMMTGYSKIGSDLTAARIDIMKNNTSQAIPLGNGRLVIHANDVGGVRQYRADIVNNNGKSMPLKSFQRNSTVFNNEEDIMEAYGELMH